MTDVVVVGGGIGGMVAALRARQHGGNVTLVEARSELGGLASPLQIDGMTFDGGPYILLDRVRLRWALGQVEVDLDSLPMKELDPAYQVTSDQYAPVTISSDIAQTAGSLNAIESGMGDRYRQFVDAASTALDQLAPLFTHSHSASRVLSTGAWRAAPWALLSLSQILQRHGVSGAAADAVRIWTHIAGGDPKRAPGPMALVPALIHRDGAARPIGGIHNVIGLLERKIDETGIHVLRDSPVAAINHRRGGGAVEGVTLESGEKIDADIVISDVGGAAALLDLVEAKPPPTIRARMAGPLQSPGLTAYLRLKGTSPAEIRFRVEGEPKQAYALIHAAEEPGDWAPGRLITPLSHAQAERLGVDGQRELLDRLLTERWWHHEPERDSSLEAEVVATRLVGDWGRTFRLRDDAMNLSMARRQMLLGRLPHRIKHISGLFLTGSWTHPGQWISFCSVSGVLAANEALELP